MKDFTVIAIDAGNCEIAQFNVGADNIFAAYSVVEFSAKIFMTESELSEVKELQIMER